MVEEFISKMRPDDFIPVLALVLTTGVALVIPTIAIIVGSIRRYRERVLVVNLIQELLERGLPTEEIERLLHASVPQSEAERLVRATASRSQTA